MENIDYSIEKYKEDFFNYASPFLENSELKSPLKIKIDHTFRVLEMGTLIAQDMEEHLRFPLQLACLFHDLGRFEQVKKYKTFLDAKSVNHAVLSVKVLKEQGFIVRLPKEMQSEIYTAIQLHNKLELPHSLSQDMRLLCLALRDADKVDIIRVMVENFENPDGDADTVLLHVKDEEKYTQSIYENLLLAKAIKYTDLRYANDFRLLIGGWLNEIHFSSALETIKERKYMDTILEKLPKDENMQRAKKYIYSLLNR